MDDSYVDDIYDELDLLTEELESHKFVASYNNKKSYGRVNYAKPMVVALSIVAFIMVLVFATNNLVDVDVNEVATVKSTNNYTKGVIIEQTAAVKEQIIEDSKEDILYNTSLTGVEFYVMDLPYTLTLEEMGGYAIPSIDKNNKPKAYMSSDAKSSHLGGKFAFTKHTSLAAIASTDWSNFLKDFAAKAEYDSTGCAQLEGRYLASTGAYFFPDSIKYTDFSIYSTGWLFDVVLKDGTVIPFMKWDSKATAHTNNSTSNSTYTKARSSDTKYNNVFQAYDGSVIEVVAKDNASIALLREKYGQSEDNPIVKVIMYDKTY